jgi:hypothetical protein
MESYNSQSKNPSALQPSFSSINKIGGSPITLLQSVSMYSPLIIMISILVFSIFSSALGKGLFYVGCVFFVTAIRILFLYYFSPGKGNNRNEICNIGTVFPFTGWSYSTYLLTFTACYFIVPMFILTSMNKTNMVNYWVVMFFTAYIGFDIWIKSSLDCIILNSAVLGDFLVGGLFGSLIALVLFYSDKISLLFINELNSNKEVCSVPSKQQFRCSLYKNGTIVGSSISA